LDEKGKKVSGETGRKEEPQKVRKKKICMSNNGVRFGKDLWGRKRTSERKGKKDGGVDRKGKEKGSKIRTV